MLLLSVSNVVQIFSNAGLAVSEDTIRNFADRGQLPCMRTKNGSRLFQQEEVIKFIAHWKEKKIALKLQAA